jgi:predicted TIM-barrel enzyme
MTIENAHIKGTETGSLVFSVDRQTVLTRGGDDTVKCKCFMCFGGEVINRPIHISCTDLRRLIDC